MDSDPLHLELVRASTELGLTEYEFWGSYEQNMQNFECICGNHFLHREFMAFHTGFDPSTFGVLVNVFT